MNLIRVSTSILKTCMNLQAGETVLVITDDEKLEIGEIFYRSAKELGTDANA